MDGTERGFCPLIVAGFVSTPMRPDGPEKVRAGVMCHGPRCAWWDDPRQECAILSAAKGRK